MHYPPENHGKKEYHSRIRKVLAYIQAGTIGWAGIFIVSAVYLLTTLVIMLSLVSLGMKGAGTFKSHFLEHHEKRITGIVLVALGILALFVKF